MVWVDQRLVVVSDSFFCIGSNQSLIQKLTLFMVDIGDQQREEDVQLLDLFCQNGVLIDNAIYQLIGAQVLLTDLTDIDALLGGRAYGDKLTSYIVACAQELMSLQRSDNEYLRAFTPHAQSDQLEREGLTCAACSKKYHIGVFVNPAIEDIHDDQAVVMLINTEQDAILVTHLKRGEGIATGRRGCQHIALAGLEQLLIQLTERKDREKRLFLPEAADTNVHIL